MSQEEFFKTVIQILNNINIPYMLTGSMASNFYSIPRTTHDIDFVVIFSFGDIEKLLQNFNQKRYYLDEEMIKEAIINKDTFNLIDSHTGLKIDFWILKDDEYHQTCFKRRIKHNILGLETYISTAEDVILSKLQWCKLSGGSELQFKDAVGVYEIQKKNLDMDYIKNWAGKISVQELLEKLIEVSTK